MDTQQWWDSYQARLADLGTRATAGTAALTAVDGTATSENGAVTITVDAAGAPRRLLLAPASEGLPRAELAAAVLQAADRARAQAATRALAAVAPLVGSDEAALGMLGAALPTDRENRP